MRNVLTRVATMGRQGAVDAPVCLTMAVRREWLPVALAAAGLASSVIGGVKSSEAARKAERRQREREAEENAYYTRRYNEDYADTAAGQNLIRRAKDYARENWRKAAGAQAVAGGTDAAAAMAKEAGNKMVGDTLANIAAQDTARKANVDAQHNAARQAFAQQDMARDTARAQAIAQASAAASNAMMSAAGVLGQDSAGSDLMGGSNKGIKTTTSAEDPRWNGVHVGADDIADSDAWARAHGEAMYGYRP